jgi:hypothetical protein
LVNAIGDRNIRVFPKYSPIYLPLRLHLRASRSPGTMYG